MTENKIIKRTLESLARNYLIADSDREKLKTNEEAYDFINTVKLNKLIVARWYFRWYRSKIDELRK